MTDEIIPDPPAEPAPAALAPAAPEPAEPIGPVRTLTDAELVAYQASLGALGFTFAVQGLADEAIGFRVSGNGDTLDYRYNEGDTAVSLMDRIVAELGG